MEAVAAASDIEDPAVPAEPLGPSEVLASLSEPQLLEWRKTGALPEPSKIAAAADPAPAEPVAQAASTDATPEPASEPVKKKANADTRVQELLADRAAERLRAERAERELQDLKAKSAPDAKPAASSPAPTGSEFPEYDAYLAQHPGVPYEQYLDARSDFRLEQRFKADAAQREITSRVEQSRTRVADAIKADPTFVSKLSPEVQGLKPIEALRLDEPATALNALASEVLKSPLTPVLMLHFSEHPEDLARFGAIATPYEFMREFGKLEGQLSSAPAQAAPQPKTQTDAPLPGTTLGSKPATPGDPVLSAIRQHDTGAYIKEMNARELAARKR